MNFSKTTDYTLRILSHMANDSDKMYQANDLHKILNIPYRYLRKLLTLHSKGELLISIQGKDGGYKLNRNPKSIFLIDIVKATNDNILDKKCFFGYDECSLNTPCSMHHKWTNITNNIHHILESTNLAELTMQ